MRITKSILQYIFSILFALCAFVQITESILAVVGFLLMALVLFPPFLKLVEKKGIPIPIPARALILVVGFFVVGASGPSPEVNSQTAGNITAAGQETEEEAEQTETAARQEETPESEMESESETSAPAAQLTVHFLDVGNADCILIESDSQYMLVDAGNNGDDAFIIDYLEEQGVSRLEYAIGTHPHEDHIGSLDSVIEHFEIGEVIMPDKIHTTQTFEDVIDALEEKDLAITLPVVGDTYQIGKASFTIVSPSRDYGDALNDWSVGILLENGSHRFLMCGDAESAAEADMLESGIDLTADVYKVNHHGSKTSTGEAFLEAVDPAYAVLLCGADNAYGHPHAEILEKLAEQGAEVFRTDEQGTIVVSSDGRELTWNTKPSDSMKIGTERKKEQETELTREQKEAEEAARMKQEQEEEARIQQEKEAAARIEQEKEEAARMKQEEEAARIRQEEEAARIKQEEEAARIQEEEAARAAEAAQASNYIGNRNTKKFHETYCSYLPDAKNQVSLSSREEAVNSGYEACKKCNP